MSLPLSYPDTPQALSVSQISTYLKQYIEKGFSAIYVQGEISGCKRHSSGHTYFSLKDENAVLDAICWRGTALNITLQEGLMVLCRGRITTYGMRSKYQMIVESAEAAGQGSLLQMIEALKIKLTQEGLFQSARKKQLPRFPRCIALITSATGAVIQDMRTRFEQRLPCTFTLFPVNVQGAQTVPDILRVLRHLERLSQKPDLIIIARGGGSIEDLWPFNNEDLVRAVAHSTIPIISAIGHETDTTLIDYAADLRAPTPTAAAESALPLISDLRVTLEGFLRRAVQQLGHNYTFYVMKLDNLCRRFLLLSTLIQPLQQRIDDMMDMLQMSLLRYMQRQQHAIDLIMRRLHSGMPDTRTRLAEVVFKRQRLENLMMQQWSGAEMRIEHMAQLLDKLSYQRTLERGFGLVTFQEQVCTSATQLESNQEVRLHFHDGALDAKILDKC